MRDVVAKIEEFRENDVENSKHEKRTQNCPKITENGPLVAEFKVGFDELAKQDTILAAEDARYSHNIDLF